MEEQLTNILDMITDVERKNWPAKTAIPEIKKVVAVLAEQAGAAEQGQACKHVHPLRQITKDGEMEYICADCATSIEHKQPAQPPAGDVVKRMLDAIYVNCSDGNRKLMAAALAIAREGYVSLEDALGPLTDDERDDVYADGGSFRSIQSFLANRRARLAKPAKQTDEQKVEAILTKHFHHIGVVDAAAEIVAALRDGKEGK